MNTLEGELNAIKSERDARVKEKAEAQKVVEALKAEIAGKDSEFAKEKAATDRVNTLEGELNAIKASVMPGRRKKQKLRRSLRR